MWFKLQTAGSNWLSWTDGITAIEDTPDFPQCPDVTDEFGGKA